MGLDAMVAITHRGAVVHYWDHLVITLRDEQGAESAFLSLYAITYSPTLGPGHVAIVEVAGPPGDKLSATFTDDVAVGRRQQQRLRAMGDRRAALTGPPIPARFERLPFREGSFGFSIRAADTMVEARWAELDTPVWVDGQAGGFSDREDIWSILVGAARATLTINAVPVQGQPWPDAVWRSKLGRSLSSAHGAFAEVRVDPAGGSAIVPLEPLRMDHDDHSGPLGTDAFQVRPDL